MCHSYYRVLRLSGVQVVLISDSINDEKGIAFGSGVLHCNLMKTEISRERVTMYLLGPSFPTQSLGMETCTAQGCVDFDCAVKQHFCVILKCVQFKK